MDGEKKRKKHNKPTLDEDAEREDYIYDLLSMGIHKSEIKRRFREKYDVSPRTIERYLARARARILLFVDRAKNELRAESAAFYDALTREPIGSVREKIMARERFDKILGLEAPQKIAPTTPDGENEYRNLSDDELNARIAAKLAERTAGGMVTETGTD